VTPSGALYPDVMHQMESRVKKPEIELIQEFVENSEVLFKTLEKDVEWDERMKARKTASFGVSYDYSGITYTQNKMHPLLVPICNDIKASLGLCQITVCSITI